MISPKEYLLRIGKSKGFGIQSPWAYRFVREVVAERWRYYAYDDIERCYPSRYERKYQKFLFRLRNYVSPHTVMVCDIRSLTPESLSDAILSCGPHGAVVIEGIRYDKSTLALWRSITLRSDIGITFDMYSFAVCFLDGEIYKQHYKLNFL